MMNGRI